MEGDDWLLGVMIKFLHSDTLHTLSQARTLFCLCPDRYLLQLLLTNDNIVALLM